MTEIISLDLRFYYHNILSLIMVGVWVYFGYRAFTIKDNKYRYKLSIYLIIFCLFQELIDFINRIFLDPVYLFSIQRDLPFIQFCQISFYFALFCMYVTKDKTNYHSYSLKHFFFDCSFLLGFSGAFQAIITPDFHNINNLLGVICIQFQHSLIILSLIWLMIGYGYRLQFKGLCYTYLMINLIVPFALLINNYLGVNSAGEMANYFYVSELPTVDNYFLNLISQHPSPDYILYMQPIIICYFLLLYLPFIFINNYEKN